MTSNIEKIIAIANHLVGLDVTIRECHSARTRSYALPRHIEKGVCTEVLLVWCKDGPAIEIVIDNLRTEIHYPRKGHVEIISEGRWTNFRFPVSSMTINESNLYRLFCRLYFNEPARDYLSGNAVIEFQKR